MNVIRRLLPARLKRFLRALYNLRGVFAYYPRDISRFLRHSAALQSHREYENLNSRVIADAHIIEKGLSLSEPRLGFGEAALERIQDELAMYHERHFPTDGFAYQFASSVLQRYVEFNESHGYDVSRLKNRCSRYFGDIEDVIAGTRSFTCESMAQLAQQPFSEFTKSRVSCRQFSGESVDMEKVKDAIAIARNAPSVCNRQSVRVIVVDDQAAKTEVLRLQQGNRGFGSRIDKALVVCADLNAFFSYEERNQAFIDGGLFGMSLLYSLAHMNIAACPLNWCADYRRDDALREVVPLKASEVVIMVVGIGGYPNAFSVAASHRKSLQHYMQVV